jgi:hypothetical protein
VMGSGTEVRPPFTPSFRPPFTPSLSRGALIALFLLVSCKHVEQVEDESWTPPPSRKEEPVQQPDPSCPARAPLVRGQCRANTDCFYSCVRDVERRQYGDCACPEGQVCERWYGGAYPGSGQGCRPGCKGGEQGLGGRLACLTDEVCAANGRCEALLCGQDYKCPPGMSCTPGEHGADVHGCSGAPCAADKDCPCPSYCVLGQCQGSGGRCEHPRA